MFCLLFTYIYQEIALENNQYWQSLKQPFQLFVAFVSLPVLNPDLPEGIGDVFEWEKK